MPIGSCLLVSFFSGTNINLQHLGALLHVVAVYLMHSGACLISYSAQVDKIAPLGSPIWLVKKQGNLAVFLFWVREV